MTDRAESSAIDQPGVDSVAGGPSGGPRDNPLIPCHECGTEERFIQMKRDPKWTLEYLDAPHWVAYCPECDPRE